LVAAGAADVLRGSTPSKERTMAKRDRIGRRRVLDARPDTPDFRDKVYEATLVEVPRERSLGEFVACKPTILDQGQEGACTGFGLAAVANYLLKCRAKGRRGEDVGPVSPRMFYEMARRYDEWAGEDYEGSSARGAMKGWHKHGVCSDEEWPYDVKDPGLLTDDRSQDAARRPLGAYYRVNHKDLVQMHSAISEVGILYATATVHRGWMDVGKDGLIEQTDQIEGGHAFAIVGFDERGFWIQNSWGKDYGKGGFCQVTYDDWLANGTDVWVARLGAPVNLQTARGQARSRTAAAGGFEGYSFADLRPHIISIGNDGRLRTTGTYGTGADQVREIIATDLPAITRDWGKRRILLYAHGGLVDEASAVQRVAQYREGLLSHEVYPLSFIWKTDAWTTLKNILSDALQRRGFGFGFRDVTDFMEDRIDDALEPLARTIGGKAMWDEMKENARLASAADDGGARLAAALIAGVYKEAPGRTEIHLAGHSAGGIFHAYLAQRLAEAGVPITTCTLWAPACTVEVFKQTYAPLIQGGGIQRFALFTLTDRAERDDTCANIYKKSLLYLVSDAFEAEARVPLLKDGVPILGMERFVRADGELMAMFDQPNCQWVLSPNAAPVGDADASRSTSHGGFDDDEATLKATLARIVGAGAVSATTPHLSDKAEGLLARLMPVPGEMGVDVAGNHKAPAKRQRSTHSRRTKNAR
jgi:hypothetical protein